VFSLKRWSRALWPFRRSNAADDPIALVDDCARRLVRAPEKPRRLDVHDRRLRALHGRDPPSF
jgi:hypothetical protein